MVRTISVNHEHSRFLPIDCAPLLFSQGLPRRHERHASGFNFFIAVDKAIPGRSIAPRGASFLACLVVKLRCLT